METNTDHLISIRAEALNDDPFMLWAKDYFSPESGNLGKRLLRSDIFRDFMSSSHADKTRITKLNFRAKLIQFCTVAGYDFNKHMRSMIGGILISGIHIGIADKFINKEYITITKH